MRKCKKFKRLILVDPGVIVRRVSTGKNRLDYRTHAKNSWVREIKRIFGALVDTEYRELSNIDRYLKFAALEKCRVAFRAYAEGPIEVVGGAEGW
jgi:hypothetical protein